MKIQTSKAVLFLFCFVFIQSAFAQTANEYLHGMNIEFDKIKNEYFDYINQVAHGKSAKKAESKRMEVLTTIKGSKNTISKMKGFNGSTALRDSLISFLNLNYNVMANDYAKIMDLEAISEQSYDYMEAYIMAQDIANQKIDDGSKMVSASVEVFAKANGIELKESTDSRDRILRIASAVMNYESKINLIMLKSNFQERIMVESISKNDLTALQQSREALLTNSAQGLKTLDTIPPFKNDPSVETACANLLKFYQDEAKNQMPTVLDFLLAKDNFEKIKKVVESKPKTSVTKEESDQYNAAVTKYNASVVAYNTKNNTMNTKRAQLTDEWNKSLSTFLDKHIPKK